LKIGFVKHLKHCFLLTVNKDSTDFLYFGNFHLSNLKNTPSDVYVKTYITHRFKNISIKTQNNFYYAKRLRTVHLPLHRQWW